MFQRFSCSSRLLAALAACGLALHLGATPPPDDVDLAAGSSGTPWLSPGLQWRGPTTFGERYAPDELRWQRRDGASQWFARVTLGPLHATEATSAAGPAASTLQGEAQWLYRGFEGHVVRLGAQGRHDLLQPAATLGAYAHDEWTFAPGWRLALGARGDTALQAASVLAPRAALAWQPATDVEVRLVDGLAWRDPHSLAADGFATSSAGGIALRTTEVALQWQALPAWRLTASMHRQRDEAVLAAAAPGAWPALLRFAQPLAPTAAGDGVGLDADYGSERWRVRTRVAAFQNRALDDGAAEAPTRVMAALQAQVPLPWSGARAGLEWLWVDQRAAAPGATLSQTLFNATLAWAPVGSPWRVAAQAYNLGDHAVVEPAAADVLVREGRRWQLQVARSF